MAVQLMSLPRMEEQKAIEEAATEGLKGMENLIHLLSHQPSHLNTHLTDATVSNFKKLISLLNRTGHARFRRAPLPSNTQPIPPAKPVTLHQPPSTSAPTHSHTLTLDFTKPNIFASTNANSMDLEFSKETFSVSSNSSFMSSAITADGSVSNGNQGSSLFLTPPPPPPSAGKPPLVKKRCHDNSGKLSGSTKCHCIKRRYTRVAPCDNQRLTRDKDSVRVCVLESTISVVVQLKAFNGHSHKARVTVTPKSFFL